MHGDSYATPDMSAESFGDLAAAANQARGVSALKMDQENAAPNVGKQHLPPENQLPHKLTASDSDKVAVPAEQPEQERPPGRGACADTAEARSARAQAPSR